MTAQAKADELLRELVDSMSCEDRLRFATIRTSKAMQAARTYLANPPKPPEIIIGTRPKVPTFDTEKDGLDFFSKGAPQPAPRAGEALARVERWRAEMTALDDELRALDSSSRGLDVSSYSPWLMPPSTLQRLRRWLRALLEEGKP